MGPHKQCDPSHCREVDVQLGVVSQHGSTQAVRLLPLEMIFQMRMGLDDIRLTAPLEIIFWMRMCCSLNQMVASHFHLQSYTHFLSVWGLLTLK